MNVTVEVSEELGRRLSQAAQRASLSVSEYVERALSEYLSSHDDNAVDWVRTTTAGLSRVWNDEDFTDWHPPHAS